MPLQTELILSDTKYCVYVCRSQEGFDRPALGKEKDYLKFSPTAKIAAFIVLSLSAVHPVCVNADPHPTKKTASPTGKVPSSSASPATVTSAPVPNRRATRGQYLARTALAYRGLPYRFGGTSPRTGFDCSGLVQAVCAKWGIYLPRAARAQFHVGVPVKPNKLQPGDLVFFKNTYRHALSHVGIAVGDGFFVHAAGRGKGVRLSRLDQGYYKKHWAGAKRLNLSKLPPVPGEEAPEPAQVLLDEPEREQEATAPSEG
jgi:cell wall-associated NlpC family hydrolase